MESCNLNDVMRAIGNLEGSMKEGFEGVHRRQDIANGRLNKHEEEIDKLKDSDAKESGRRSAFNWVGNVLAGTVGLIAGLIGSYIQAGKL